MNICVCRHVWISQGTRSGATLWEPFTFTFCYLRKCCTLSKPHSPPPPPLPLQSSAIKQLLLTNTGFQGPFQDLSFSDLLTNVEDPGKLLNDEDGKTSPWSFCDSSQPFLRDTFPHIQEADLKQYKCCQIKAVYFNI